MMKKIILFVFFSMMVVAIHAQSMREVSSAQQKSMVNKINTTATAIRTIQCSFVQTKKMSFLNDKMVSRGVMYYDNHSRLRWEYTSPYKYIFILNNNKVYIKSARKTNTIDIKSSRLFQSIARIMMNSVTGRSLTDNGDFSVKMYVNGDEWVAFLTPKRSDMKKMFKSIHLYFDSSRSMVSKVEMLEKNGDSTVILLHGVKTNTGINEKVFSAN